jgi:hypothetical protein
LDLLQLIARGHCKFSTVEECCFALCKESAPVLQPYQVLSQEKLAILEGIELQHANQYFPTLQENLQCCKSLIANFEKETEDCYDFGF